MWIFEDKIIKLRDAIFFFFLIYEIQVKYRRELANFSRENVTECKEERGRCLNLSKDIRVKKKGLKH